MQLNIGFSLLLLSLLLLGAQAKPTFDKMAEVLLEVLDDRPHYTRPVPVHYAPVHPVGPGIQESYEHGYDYNYGGGGGHSYGEVYAPPVYGYYPPPAVQGPVKGNYYAQPPYQHQYPATRPTYGHGYGRQAPAETAGYKHYGY